MFRIALLLLAWHTVSAAVQESASEHADKAAELVQHGDLTNAEKELRKAIELTPSDPTLLTSLGGVLGMQGQLEQANTYFARAVRLRPDDALLRRNLAANEWQLGRFQAAQHDLELLLKANPSDNVAIFLLGMVEENVTNYSRSIALLTSIPEIVERRPEALVALASSYYHLNQREKARACITRLMGSPASAQVLANGGRVAMDHQEYLLALRMLTKAADGLPDSYRVFLMKANVESKLSYYSQAVASARRACELHSSVETRRELALTEWRAGDRRQAVSDFEALKREFPNDAETYETYGTLLLEGGSPEDKSRAITMLKQAIALNPSSVEACYQIANIELAEGHPELALQQLERATKVDPNDSRLHFALSRVYRRLERNTAADRELQVYQKLKAAQN